MKIKKYRNAYKNAFEKRFKKEISLSIEKSEEDFYIQMIQLIVPEYKNIINQQSKLGNDNYIIQEKIRLEVKLNQKEKGPDETLIDMVKTILPISTFGVGIAIGMSNDSLKMLISNKIVSISEKTLATEFTKIYSDTIINLGKSVMLFVILLILISLITWNVSNYLNNRTRSNNNIIKGFNMMCLSVLKEIETGKV